MEKYIRESDAVQTVMEKPDMTPDEKAGIIRRLEAIPAADVVAVVHARPVKFYCDARTGRMITTCSACDLKIGPYDSFCKHCGAKMDGGQHE